VSAERVLVVLVAANGQVSQRAIEERGEGDQRELDQMARALNERLSGRTLGQVHGVLRAEIERMRDQADRMLMRARALGLRALDVDAFTPSDLVVATRLAILDQPEFADPARIKSMLAALETHERLIDVLEQIIDSEGVTVSLGDDLAESGLRGCAMVAVPYGRARAGDAGVGGHALGVVGVIGPNRMDYSRIVPLVSYCSSLVTRKLQS
jgi:heat-inducible transcriptional repressor